MFVLIQTTSGKKVLLNRDSIQRIKIETCFDKSGKTTTSYLTTWEGMSYPLTTEEAFNINHKVFSTNIVKPNNVVKYKSSKIFKYIAYLGFDESRWNYFEFISGFNLIESSYKYALWKDDKDITIEIKGTEVHIFDSSYNLELFVTIDRGYGTIDRAYLLETCLQSQESEIITTLLLQYGKFSLNFRNFISDFKFEEYDLEQYISVWKNPDGYILKISDFSIQLTDSANRLISIINTEGNIKVDYPKELFDATKAYQNIIKKDLNSYWESFSTKEDQYTAV